jgi:hypothetical protein
VSVWGRCGSCGFTKAGISNGQVCLVCLERAGWTRESHRQLMADLAAEVAPETVAEARSQLERRFLASWMLP